MIKVPGTASGVDIFRELTDAGIHINVTLLFSLRQYEAVARAYINVIFRRAHFTYNQAVDCIKKLNSRCRHLGIRRGELIVVVDCMIFH